MPESPWPQSDGFAAQAPQVGIPVMAAAWPMPCDHVSVQPPMVATRMKTPTLADQPAHVFATATCRTSMPYAAQLAKPPGVFTQVARAGPSGPSILSSESRTTVLFRNLPKRFSRSELLDLLNSNGFRGRYDFVYLPFNFDSMESIGHAFVNLLSLSDVARLWEEFDGFSTWSTPCESTCTLAWNDKQQGLLALIERYRNSPVMHEKVPGECKPLIFSGGEEVSFPAPTEVIKPPKFRKGKRVNSDTIF